MPVKAVIFDLDNTLYNEARYIDHAYGAISKYVSELDENMNRRRFYEALKRKFAARGSQYPRLFNEVLADHGIYGQKLLKSILRLYSSVAPNIKLYPSALAVLKRLKKGHKLCLITNGNVTTQKNKVKLLKLSRQFDSIVYARALSKSQEKPSPAPYLLTLKRLGVSAAEAVYVGDNPLNDFSGAKKIGIKTIRLLKGEFKNLEVAQKDDADHRVSDLRGVERYLKGKRQ